MFSNRSSSVVVALLLCIAPLIQGAQLYYSPISINSGQVPSTQTDFPVLVSQTDNRFKTISNGGHVNNSSGFDIRPYSDSGLSTALTYELERYNASTGEVVMWVKVASLSSSTTPIYLGYGDTSLTTDGSSSNTWSNSFTDVYHLKDGSTLSVNSSAPSGHNGTNHSATATSGNIDGAGGFVSASSQYIDTASLNVGSPVTFSAWVNATSFPNSYNSVVFINLSNTSYYGFMVKSNGKVAWLLNPSGVSQDGTGSNTLSASTWYYLVMVYDTTNGLACYVNASSDVTHSQNGSVNITTALDISRDAVNSGRYWNGTLDEVRTASTNRSANWITTEYNNQSAPGTFESLGTEVAVGGVQNGWFMFFP